ncbi:hypothetical protein M404DRAFT_335844 [Pisolithus tinctorius Marx 270]|uniref:Uncharacterized protein n=1 Tax=Pisolithus tinctorius Marx 270 TaxID=870435 RepID=A0A0C3N1G3_PISTI|nr:hypothetical protein M404DRAFT_335844 [Pisolithus tinctorius Marx 270]
MHHYISYRLSRLFVTCLSTTGSDRGSQVALPVPRTTIQSPATACARVFVGGGNTGVAEPIARPAELVPPFGAAFTSLLPMALLHCGNFAIRSISQR